MSANLPDSPPDQALPSYPPEIHYSQRTGWLRAAVLGANDGILSTASLIVGVAAAQAMRGDILLAGIAGMVAGAMSMAAGEYVSVSSQADTEKADLERESRELKFNSEYELNELSQIYVQRGLEPELARTVAQQLMTQDALGTHAREELGITKHRRAKPLQAAMASAGTFFIGATLPLAVVLVAPLGWIAPAVALSSLVCLAGLGALAAWAGGASAIRGAARVAFWGTVAMALTALVGAAVGTVI